LVDYVVRKKKYDVRLLVVGDGMERERCRRDSAQRMPGHVVFLGHVKDRRVLADIYANCDVFVHPNPREPFGIAPLEAMASGLPLIAPNAGGVTSFASPDNAWTVPAKVESFAAALEEVIENKELASRKTSSALATAQSYRWEIVASSFLELYGQMLRAARGEAAALPPPDFHSTLATGLRAELFRGAASAAERTFGIASRFTRRWLAQDQPPGPNRTSQESV
jgi:glycogen synthase